MFWPLAAISELIFYTLFLDHFSTLASSSTFAYSRAFLTSGPLHSLVTLPGMPFFQRLSYLSPSSPPEFSQKSSSRKLP